MNLKVISFNIRCCDDDNGNSVKERAPRLSAVVNSYDADVIGFQEYTPLWEEYVDKYFCNNYELFNVYRDNIGWLESAPILWKKDKFNCLNKGCFWLSDTPEVMSNGWDLLGYNRICLYAVLQDKTSGKTFTVMNTHFGFGDECHIKSIQLIKKYAQTISNNPTSITGDFNMQPTSLGYKEITKSYFNDVNALTVNDKSDTFHGYKLPNKVGEHIDYCFINNKIKPINYKIITDAVNGQYPSDHYGVYSELEI